MGLKIGDKLEVATDQYESPKGTILTVTKVYNSSSNNFEATDPAGIIFWFWDLSITGGYLKSISPGPLPFVPIPNHVAYPTWKIEDIKPWVKFNPIPICECGADKHGFASHSTWCEKA